MTELKSMLAECNVSQGLNDEELELLLSTGDYRTNNKDEIIIGEGSNGRELYVILEGRISIEVESSSGDPTPLHINTIRQHDCFGEFAFLDGAPRSASGRVLSEAVKLFVIDQEKIDALIESNPHFGLKFMRNLVKVLCARIRQTDLEWRSLLMW